MSCRVEEMFPTLALPIPKCVTLSKLLFNFIISKIEIIIVPTSQGSLCGVNKILHTRCLAYHKCSITFTNSNNSGNYKSGYMYLIRLSG